MSGGLAQGVKSFSGASVIPVQLGKKSNIFENISVQDAYDFLTPLLISRNVERIAFLVARFERSIYPELLEKILSLTNTNISALEKLEFLGYLLATCDEKDEFYELFDLLLLKKDDLQLDQFMSFVSDPLYDKVLRTFIVWYDSQNEKKQKKIFDKIISPGIMKIIDDNQVKRFEWFLANSSFISSQAATILLDYVVDNKKQSGFILPLVAQTKANIDHQNDHNKTLLIRAVEQDNLEIVRALLQNGANVSLIPSQEIGNALQNAIINGYVAIELLLRSYGAR
jgi:hypothetical protein